MKSKAEIIDAINRCGQFENHCDGCPYGDFGDEICIDLLFDDIISIFNKSDFEITKEILGRATQVKADNYVPVSGEGNVIEVSSSKDEVAWIWFDKDGNIL